MNVILTVSVAVIAAVMVAGVILCIPVLLQIRRVAQQVETLTESVRTQIAPVSRDVTVVSQEVHAILESVHRQVDRVEDSVITVRDGARRLVEFEEDVLLRVERPLYQISTLLSALQRGFWTFFRVLRE